MTTQIALLGQRMDQGLAEIKTMLKGFEERLRALENREAGCQPIVQSRMDAAWRRLDHHDAELNKVVELHGVLTRDQIQLTGQIKNLQNVLRWVLGIFTGILLTVLGALATGQATIVFK